MLSISTLYQQNRKDFDCGQPELNHYIQCLASQHIKQNISRVYVASFDSHKVIGFYSLSYAQIEFEKVNNLLPKRYPTHYPVPVARLGRFAVDKSLQGQGIGNILLSNALYRCYETSKQIGMTGVIVNAKNDKAQQFYIKHGFIPLEQQPFTLIILTKTLELLFN